MPVGNSPVLNINAQTTVACNNTTGTAHVVATGGTAPYQYSGIGSVNTTGNYQSLSQGVYTVNVTSNEGCTGSDTFTITGSPAIIVSVDSIHAKTLCNQNNGYVAALASGGTSTLTFSLSGSQNTTGIFAGLAAGNYSVTVTDALGCSASSPAVVPTNTPVLSITDSIITNTKCASYNGAINVDIGGGATPYTFRWSNGPTTQDMGSLNGGSYTVTVTDNGSCTATKQITVPDSVATVSVSTLNVSANTQCLNHNGTITVDGSGGSSPYVYHWSNSESTAAIGNLPGGSLTVTVTDANLCSAVGHITVPDSTPVITPTITQTNETVLGSHDGTAQVAATGGQTPYTYHWSVADSTGSAVSHLAPGSYIVTVTDANGCSGTATFSISAGPSAINNVSGNAGISVYPNPATNQLSIESQLINSHIDYLHLYDITGKLLNVEFLQQSGKLILNVSLLNAGMYYAALSSSGTTATLRFVKGD